MISSTLSPTIYESILMIINSNNLITCGCCNTSIVNIKHYYDMIVNLYDDKLLQHNISGKLPVFNKDIFEYIYYGYPVINMDFLFHNSKVYNNIKTLVLSQHNIVNLLDTLLPSRWIVKDILFTNIKHSDTITWDLGNQIEQYLDFIADYNTYNLALTPIFTITISLCRAYVMLYYIG